MSHLQLNGKEDNFNVSTSNVLKQFTAEGKGRDNFKLFSKEKILKSKSEVHNNFSKKFHT